MTHGILIGKTVTAQRHEIGFTSSAFERQIPSETDIVDACDAGLVTIAATGAGKGVTQIIPNVLTYPGSMIIVDIKGEIAAVTARRRREMGQKVYVLNPFCEGENDYLNPFDLIEPDKPETVDQCRMIADLLTPSSIRDDPFWDDRARDLITGAFLFIAEHVEEDDRAIHLAHNIWSSDTDHLVGLLAFMRESSAQNGALRRFAHQYIDAPDKTRGSIQSTLMGHLMPLGTRSGHRAFSHHAGGNSVDLKGLSEGEPMTIYLTVPPHYLHTHGAFLRIWVGVLLSAMKLRQKRPEHPTLFLVDEAAQLGRMDQLLNAATLMRGYGLRVWTFWQSIAQLERIYGPAGQEFIDNASTISVFGMSNGPSAASAAKITGWEGSLLGMDKAYQVIAQSGMMPHICGRVSYLRDPRFKGMYDQNPFYVREPAHRKEAYVVTVAEEMS